MVWNVHLLVSSLPPGHYEGVVLLDEGSQLARVPLEVLVDLPFTVFWVQATVLHRLRVGVLQVHHHELDVGDDLVALVSHDWDDFLLVLRGLSDRWHCKTSLLDVASTAGAASLASSAAVGSSTLLAATTSLGLLVLVVFSLFDLLALALGILVLEVIVWI